MAALSNPWARNAVLELGGPEALSQLEAVRIFEEISGEMFEKQFVSEKALQAQKGAAANPVERTFADISLCAARGDKIDTGETFTEFSVQPRSVRDHATTVVHAAGSGG